MCDFKHATTVSKQKIQKTKELKNYGKIWS